MAAPCLGHECAERRYRAIVKSSSVTNQKGTKCPTDAEIVASIVKGWVDDAFEQDHCDEKVCKCDLPNWPAKWTALEQGVVYTGTYLTMECSASVTITYDWECQERSAKCYRKAPTKGQSE